MVCVYREDSMCLEILGRNNPLAKSSCTQRMLLFQTFNHVLYVAFAFAMCESLEDYFD